MNTFETKLDEVQRRLTQQQLNDAARATLRDALERGIDVLEHTRSRKPERLGPTIYVHHPNGPTVDKVVCISGDCSITIESGGR